MISKRLSIPIALVILLSLPAGAQFRYTASLDSVKETGFYHITITPELSSYLKTDLSDIRIVDEKKQTVPFISDAPYSRRIIHPVLFDHTITRKQTIDSKTVLVIENDGMEELSNFTVGLRSAAAERPASLSGSDNNADWFVVLDSLLLQNPTRNDKPFHSQYINFPPAAYRYFKLTINNAKKEPLNIVDVKSSRIVSPGDTAQASLVNPAPRFSQVDSGRYSLVKVMAGKPFHISHIKLGVSGPWLYKRPAKIFTKMENGLSKTWFSQSHADIVITSDNFSGYPIQLLKSDTFYLLIENGDNPPLKISSISTEQVNRRIIAQLEKGRSYSLVFDDLKAMAPVYDLQHFKTRIPSSSLLHINYINQLPGTGIIVDPKKQINKWWIWPALIAVIAVLSLLAWKLTTDMKKEVK